MNKPFWIDPANNKAFRAAPHGLDWAIVRREVVWKTTKPFIAGQSVTLHQIVGTNPRELLHYGSTCYSLSRPSGTQAPASHAVNVDLTALFSGSYSLCKCLGTQALITLTRHNVPATEAAYLLALVEKDLKGAARKTRSPAGRHASLEFLANARLILTEIDRIERAPDFVTAAHDRFSALADGLAASLAEGNRKALAADRCKTEAKIRSELGVGDSEMDDTEVVVMMSTFSLRSCKLGEIAIGNYTVESRADARMLRCPLWVWSWLAGRPRSYSRVAAATVAVLDDAVTEDDLRIAWHLYQPHREGRLNTARAALSSAILLRPERI